MEIKYFQKGFNFSQDGQGNRLVYHLQGCNLKCPWCSNPEGMRPDGGISVTTEALADEAERCRPMFFEGGGVPFTGGECTVQFEALKDALSRLTRRGISTAIETNGTSPLLPELFALIDELIIDCKHYDDEVHRRFTGIGNRRIIENLRAAVSRHPNVLIRVPLIGGFNASEDDFRNFSELFAGWNTPNVRVELLLYHEYGRSKWEKSGMEYTVRDAFVAEEERIKFESILRDRGLSVVRT